MAKKVNTVGDLDRISNLPDPILCQILSFIATKEAVRTSILSSRWKNLFSSMSTFDFTDRLLYLPDRNLENFKDFIDRLLLFPKEESLECFRLKVPSSFDSLRLTVWVLSVLRRGVKEFVLYYSGSAKSRVLQTALFTCQSLVTLKLGFVAEIRVPSNVCLPNLKTLHLIDFNIPDGDSIQRLISNCLALEEFIMKLVELSDHIIELLIISLSLRRLVLDFITPIGLFVKGSDYAIAIDAPNLEYFKYVDYIAQGYTFSNMKALAHADIRIYRACDDIPFTRDPTQLFRAISNVQCLNLFVDDGEGLSPWILDTDIEFQNLVELKIESFITSDGTWFVELLDLMPNLNTLILDVDFLEEEEMEEDELMSLPEEVPACFILHLKTIEILKFCGNRFQFQMICYFLHHARVLEKVMIEDESFIETKKIEEQEISVLENISKLSNLSSVSKKCAVRTSILAHRWRYLFASMSTLDFSDPQLFRHIRNVQIFRVQVFRSPLEPIKPNLNHKMLSD